MIEQLLAVVGLLGGIFFLAWGVLESNPTTLLAACACFGLCAAMGIWVIVPTVGSVPELLAALLDKLEH